MEILFITIDNKFQLGFELRKHLKTDDGRYILFDTYNHAGVEEVKAKEPNKQKSKKDKEGEIRLDTSKNVDKELVDLINGLNPIKRKTSKEKPPSTRQALFEKVALSENTKSVEATLVEKDEKEPNTADIKEEKEAVALNVELPEREKIENVEDDDDNDDEPLDLDVIAFEDTWEVECTQEVYRVLRSKKVQLKMKKKILRKIRDLASGYWPRDLHKRLEGVKDGIRLYEAKINDASRIIWEVSVSFSERRSMQQEVCEFLDHGETGAIYEDKIRIWNIALQHDDVPKMIEKIEHSHDRGEYCILRKNLEVLKETTKREMQKQGDTRDKKQKHPNVYMSQNVKDMVNRVMEKAPEALEKKNFFVPAASPNKNEYNILKFYSFTSQVASRILSVSHSNYDFPFQVSPLEYAVIRLEPKHRCAILLLGRSGTGKTTCCLYRLWSQFVNYWKTASLSGPQLPKFKMLHGAESDEDESDVNKSYVNEEKQAEPSIDGNDDEKIEDEEEKIMLEDCEHLRQILVTKNEVLCNEIRKNFKELSIGSSVSNYEVIDDIESRTIEEILPENYPLFVTTKDLFLLLDNSLEGDKFFERDEDGNMKYEVPGWGKNKVHLSFLPTMEESDDEEEDEEEEGHKLEAMNHDMVKKKSEFKIAKRKEVTYPVFANELWPKLMKKKGKVEKSCHPSLVWMEIKSFIKGSAEAFVSKDKEGRLTGYLSKEEYVDIGRKRAPNFEGNREEIYDIFLRYLKLRTTSEYFDEMDIHFQLYQRLKASIVPDWAFHQVYVDETQDFTQSELLLLIRSCANPNAMFFTGDTAQSIMSGVAFRFCDLKSLYLVAKSEFESLKLPSPISVPSTVHQLTHNYRSHAGILKLSSTVIKLLEKLFPTSIEVNAKPDVGLFPGPSPVILETNDFTELAILLQGSKRQTSTIEFGAHQVVLVQNEETKQMLPAELSYGLVLSIYEAKGLEFDDVLLYNFFKDSPVS